MNYTQLQLYTIGTGSIIGWGAFILPGDLFIKSAGPFLMTVALLLSALFMSIIGWAYRTIMEVNSAQGSPLELVNKLFGHWHGFIYGWVLCISYISIVGLNVTTLALLLRFYFGTALSGRYLYSLFDWSIYLNELLLSLAILLLFVFSNIRKSPVGASVQKGITIVLCSSVLFLSLALLSSKSASVSHWLPVISDSTNSWVGFFTIIAISPWAFVGFEIIPQLARRSLLSGTQIYRIMLASLLTGAVIYIFIGLSSALTFPWELVASGTHDWLVGDVVRDTLGEAGILLLGVAMLSSVMASINGFLIASSRLITSMADTGLLPDRLKNVHTKNGPLGMWLVAIMASIAPFLGRNALLQLVEVSSIGITIAFLYVSFSALCISRNNRKNYCISQLSLFISIVFFALLIIPGSPASIATESFLIFTGYMIIGMSLCRYHKVKIYSNTSALEN